MKKILVINVNWLGDVIFSIPLFKSLKNAYPGSEISCLAPSRVKEVIDLIPIVDETIVFDERGEHLSPLAKLKLIQSLKQKHFDMAFILHRSHTRAWLAYLAGIPVRVGHVEKKRGFLLTHAYQPPSGRLHRSDYYSHLLESFGISVADRMCDLSVSSEEESAARERLRRLGVRDSDFVVVINPGGNWDLKRWPKENFAGLLKQLMAQSSVKVLLSGAPKDVALVNDIVSLAGVKPIVLTGETTLKELAALFKCVDLLISGDTGPLHLASGVGTDTLSIFGPTEPELTGPRGRGKSVILRKDVGCNKEPCYFLECPKNECMHAVGVDEVINEVRRFQN